MIFPSQEELRLYNQKRDDFVATLLRGTPRTGTIVVLSERDGGGEWSFVELPGAAVEGVRENLHQIEKERRVSKQRKKSFKKINAGCGFCCVCLERLRRGERIYELSCKHAVHELCGERMMFKAATKCPACRVDISGDVDSFDHVIEVDVKPLP